MCTSETKLHHESSEDDFFGADSDGEGAAGDEQELKREGAARHQIFYNSGYRDGLDEGKERSLQQGFNIGFREGALAGFEWGMLRGAAKTLAVFDGQAAGTRGLHTQIQELEATAEVPPRAAMLDIFRRILSQPMPVPEQQAAATGATMASGGPAAAAEPASSTATEGTQTRSAQEDAGEADEEENGEDGEDEEDQEQAAREAAELAEAFRTLAASSASSRPEAASAGASGSHGVGEMAASASGQGPAGGSGANGGGSGGGSEEPAGAGEGAAGVVRIRAPPPQLVPPDAAVMALPDMAAVRAGVRRRLQELVPGLLLEGPGLGERVEVEQARVQEAVAAAVAVGEQGQ